ncbi:hypothetical protein J7J45_04295, partial [Candidatus Aerophobetes bacterium]|nr:hypothetical protein [Candidatus Aerophobetes bacterium]
MAGDDVCLLQRDLTFTYFAQREPIGDIKRHGYSRDEEKLLKEKQIEGTYILLTNDPKIPAYDALFTYKNLSEVKDFFRQLKDNLGIRPNYHRTDRRIKAHIFISHLALL